MKSNLAIEYYERAITRLKRFDGRFRARQESRLKTKLNKHFRKQSDWLTENLRDLTYFKNQERSVVKITKKQYESEIR